MVMDAELRNWQTRLAQHFAELRGRRRSNGSERPIFGLEHGLDLREVQAVTTAVRAHIVDRPPIRDHALAWIVYSSELGYRYSGDEYWQTFELETPGWTFNGDRYWIRDCYRQFQREFGGAVPSGAWAEHFSIICWPITHAILPKDLQRQLARILYELRHSFSGELLESPAMLGELIAARSWNATSRFQNLAQETQLVGQIAAALLLQGEPGSDNLIHLATLRRIGEDLDRERRAREWLRGARRFAKERAQVRGLGMLGRTATSAISRPEEARAEVAALGIEPRLVLRPTDPQGASWQPSIEIPDLSHLLLRFPRTREILTGARCVVAGVGRPLARGRCLHGAQRVTLARWPRADYRQLIRGAGRMTCPKCGSTRLRDHEGKRRRGYPSAVTCLACWRTFAILGGLFAHQAANLVETYASRRVDTYTPTPSDQREFGFTKGRKPNA